MCPLISIRHGSDAASAGWTSCWPSGGCPQHTMDAYRQDLRALGEFCEKSGICSARPENGGAADDASVPALDEQSLLLFVVWLRRRGDGHRTLARRLSSLRGFLGWCAEEN